MKSESNLRPENKFDIENIIDGKCDIVFYNNIHELEPTEEGETRYSYDTYRLNTYYRDDLEQTLNKEYQKWLEKAKSVEYNELAKAIRTKRNELLEKSDKYMCIDRLGIELPENITTTNLLAVIKFFFAGLGNSINGNYAKYRQALRDITEQPCFPYDVEFPKEPNKEVLEKNG